MTEKLRTIEVKINGVWKECLMQDIKKGDIFRYSEGPYLAVEDANMTEHDNVWGVEAEEV